MIGSQQIKKTTPIENDSSSTCFSQKSLLLYEP